MKAQILKIAGVKSEKEFYKKYKTEADFMKVHSKAFKKAQMGTLIGGGSPTQNVSKPMSYINYQDLYDKSDMAITGSTDAARAKAAYDQAVLEAQQAAAAKNEGGGGSGGGMGGMMNNIGGIMSMFGGSGGSAKRYGGDIPIAYSGFSTPNWFVNSTTTNQTTEAPGGFNINAYGINAQTLPASTPSNRLPGTQGSYPGGGPQQGPPDTSNPNWMNRNNNTIPQEGAATPNMASSSTDDGGGGPSGFTKTVKKLDVLGGPAVGIAEGYDQLRAERRERKKAQQSAAVSNVARVASMTKEEESKRRYVRPEDIQNTGEEFFPIYGVGTNVLTRNGGAIRKAQNGSYTPITEEQRSMPRTADTQTQINNDLETMNYNAGAGNIWARDVYEAKKRKEAIDQLFYNKENGIGDSKYDTFQNGGGIGGNPTEIQNTYSDGYDIYTDGGYEPLQDPFQVKDFRHGGYIEHAQNGWSNYQNTMSGGGSGFSGAGQSGGTPWGQIGTMATGAGQSATGGQNAGGKIGGTVGKSVGSIFGPAGGAIGEFVGGMAGNLLDSNPKRIKKFNQITKKNIEAMSLNSGFQGLNAQNNRYVRNGGDIDSYEDGGYLNPEYNPQVITMFGDHTAADFADYAHKYRAGGHLKEYTPPSDRAMETYAMGGQLETHWGGEAETMSYNPYSAGSGEMVKFNGQSHNESDENGQTGIGITYGENPVEVERGEPMFEMESGGEINPETGKAQTTGVVFGNMPIDKKVASQFNDPDLMEVANIYNGKKFKNVGMELAKQEAKQNKIIDKTSKLVDSFKVETSLDKIKLAGLQANMEGADTKLRNIANTKITLANYQNAINDAKDELSSVIGENLSAEDLARGYAKLDKDPVTKNAKWGGNIVKKAAEGTTIDPTKITKAQLAAYVAKGYIQDPKNPNVYRLPGTSKEVVTKIPGSEAQIKKGTPGQKYVGNATPAWKAKYNTQEKRDAYNKAKRAELAKDPKYAGTPDEVIKAAVQPSEKKEIITTPADEVFVEGETPTPEEKAKLPWLPLANQAINYFRPSDVEGLDYEQLYPEMYAMATNQVEPVPAQSYQPDLMVPYDISLQAQRNAVLSAVRNRQRQLGYNPAAQANLTPAEYNAINEINEKEFIANQGLKNQVYTGNVNTMNEAKKMNLAIFADQWAKQSQALSNTKATTQAALNSIADKYAKNKLENKTLSIYENMYNYRFGKSGRAQNYNPLQIFDTSVGGDKGGDGVPPGYKITGYDKNRNPILEKITEKNTTDDDLEAVGKTPGIGDDRKKNGGPIKKNYKNSSVVRAFKNL